jgi:hypothetical protein
MFKKNESVKSLQMLEKQPTSDYLVLFFLFLFINLCVSPLSSVVVSSIQVSNATPNTNYDLSNCKSIINIIHVF